MAGVHAPCVLVIAPVQLVLKEISLVIVGPGEGSVDATRREAEVGDGPRESFLYVIVLKQPVSVSWGEKEPGWGSATPCDTAPQHPPSSEHLLSTYCAPTLSLTHALCLAWVLPLGGSLSSQGLRRQPCCRPGPRLRRA